MTLSFHPGLEEGGWTGFPPPFCRYSPAFFHVLLAARPFQFFTLGCIFALLSSRLDSPPDTAALSLPPTQITVSICARRVEEGGEEKSIQHQTMAYRPRGVLCRKVTAIHYVWWPANGQCACRQMDCKHLSCVSIGPVARGGAHTGANTKGGQAHTHLQTGDVGKQVFVRMFVFAHAWLARRRWFRVTFAWLIVCASALRVPTSAQFRK